MQGDLGSDLILVAVYHVELCSAIAGPVYRGSSFLIRECIDRNLICNHECRVEAQSEMSDDLIIRGLILVFLDEIRRPGKGDLVDVLLYLLRSHSKTVIDEF